MKTQKETPVEATTYALLSGACTQEQHDSWVKEKDKKMLDFEIEEYTKNPSSENLLSVAMRKIKIGIELNSKELIRYNRFIKSFK